MWKMLLQAPWGGGTCPSGPYLLTPKYTRSLSVNQKPVKCMKLAKIFY